MSAQTFMELFRISPGKNINWTLARSAHFLILQPADVILQLADVSLQLQGVISQLADVILQLANVILQLEGVILQLADVIFTAWECHSVMFQPLFTPSFTWHIPYIQIACFREPVNNMPEHNHLLNCFKLHFAY